LRSISSAKSRRPLLSILLPLTLLIAALAYEAATGRSATSIFTRDDADPYSYTDAEFAKGGNATNSGGDNLFESDVDKTAASLAERLAALAEAIPKERPKWMVERDAWAAAGRQAAQA